MRRRRLVVAGTLLVVAAAVAVVIVVATGGSGTRRPHAPRVTGPAPGPAPAAAAPELGVSVNRLFNDRTYSPQQVDDQLQALRATGATVARSDALWEATEPAPPVGGVHHYAWSFDDAIAGALAAHGLQWLPIIDYSVSWARSIPGHDHSPPASAADYAAYAAALAARYGRGGAFWRAYPELTPEPVASFEIWNEPDNPSFWNPGPNPAGYARLYEAARNAIRTVDPSARVIVGGLTHPETFLPAMLLAEPGLRAQIDGVGIHPYGVDPAAVLSKVHADRALLRAAGMTDVPLYVTEFGWTTSPPGALNYVPGRLRPAYLSQTIAALAHSGCAVAAAIVYTWVTPERDPANREDWYGISPPAGGSSADVSGLTQGLRAARDPAPVAAC
jgi:polysaccharide biosynthesis protein PslG